MRMVRHVCSIISFGSENWGTRELEQAEKKKPAGRTHPVLPSRLSLYLEKRLKLRVITDVVAAKL